jgi:hypothetical protein
MDQRTQAEKDRDQEIGVQVLGIYTSRLFGIEKTAETLAAEWDRMTAWRQREFLALYPHLKK